jgi:outer membrane protein assembly factor BamA
LSNSNSAGSSFNVGIEEKNFLGTGNTLNAKTAQSKAVKELQVYFSNPYFTKDKHSISYGIFAKKTEGGLILSSKPLSLETSIFTSEKKPRRLSLLIDSSNSSFEYSPPS